MTVLQVRNACKQFTNQDSLKVFQNLNLNVPHGSIYCLLGPSGVGKTTLISCILDMSSLDSGHIEIFNKILTPDVARSISHLIGYMPQDTGLSEILTVKETLRYFAYLKEMSEKKFENQYLMIKNVLELPSDDLCIKSCSGGEKRRISFAAATIHEPKLLILDEPTVGLDSILRNKVWNYMKSLVKAQNVSILLTSHYTYEANYADCIGYMRNGQLLVEASPNRILSTFEDHFDNLDEIFLHLCTDRNHGENNFKMAENYEELEVEIVAKPRKKLSCSRIKAVFYEEVMHFKREPVKSAIGVFINIFTIILLNYAYGNIPEGLNLAYIGDQNCRNTSSTIGDDADLSCLLLERIEEQDLATLVAFNSDHEAFSNLRHGKVTGILILNANFNDSVAKWKKTSAGNLLTVILDYSDYIKTQFVILSLVRGMEEFSKDVDVKGKMRKIISPLGVEYLYGTAGNGSKQDIALPMIMCGLMLISSSYSSMSTLSFRKIGLWNRTLASGTSTFEIIVAKLLFCNILAIFLIISNVLLSEIYFDLSNISMYLHLSAMLFLIMMIGYLLGFTFSLLSSDYYINTYLVFGFANGIFVANALWPIEGIHVKLLRYIGYMYPTTLPTIAMKAILVKNHNWHYDTFLGYAILLGWILGCSITLRLVLRAVRFRT